MAPTISASQLAEQLQVSPDAILDVILSNNWQAVADNLAGPNGDRPLSAQDTADTIIWLYENDEKDKAVQALSVPLITNRMQAEQIATILFQNRRYQGTAPLMQRFQMGGAEVGADDIMSGLAVAWLAMMDSAQNGNGAGPAATNTNGAAANGSASTMKSNRMWWYIAGGIAALVVVVLLVRHFKK